MNGKLYFKIRTIYIKQIELIMIANSLLSADCRLLRMQMMKVDNSIRYEKAPSRILLQKLVKNLINVIRILNTTH